MPLRDQIHNNPMKVKNIIVNFNDDYNSCYKINIDVVIM